MCVCTCVFEVLRDWVSIESDSSDIMKRAELQRMMGVVEEKLRGMEGSINVMDIGTQTVTMQNNTEQLKPCVCVCVCLSRMY